MSRWWQRSWAVAVSGAFAATVGVLALARCKSAEREAWQRVHERAKAISAPYVRGVETVLGFVARDNPQAKGADPKSFVDESLLREIDQSGFIKKLYQR